MFIIDGFEIQYLVNPVPRYKICFCTVFIVQLHAVGLFFNRYCLTNRVVWKMFCAFTLLPVCIYSVHTPAV